MSLTEISLNIPTEHVANVFGQFDAYIKKIERTLNVTVVVRGDSMKLIGNERQIKSASNVFMQLLELSKRGNVITEQNVNYALSLAAEAKESAIVEIDNDCICHTINGKPVKPKTLGQKNYVDAIRQKMIVFGMGPAGTGKTYLAMAMAITAFKNEEVGRIILTRPAIEAGEKLGFLPGDLQSKVDPYLRPLYDALYQIMGADHHCWSGPARAECHQRRERAVRHRRYRQGLPRVLSRGFLERLQLHQRHQRRQGRQHLPCLSGYLHHGRSGLVHARHRGRGPRKVLHR